MGKSETKFNVQVYEVDPLEDYLAEERDFSTREKAYEFIKVYCEYHNLGNLRKVEDGYIEIWESDNNREFLISEARIFDDFIIEEMLKYIKQMKEPD